MSFKNGELHTLAAVGSCLLTAGLGVALYVFTDDAKAEASVPQLEDLEAIEASIATRKKPAKLPQKKTQEAPPEPVADKVNRSATEMPDPPKEKPPQDPKIDPNDPLKNVKRRGETETDSPTGPATEESGAFKRRRARLRRRDEGPPVPPARGARHQRCLGVPKILSATNAAVGCLHLTADGKISKTKLEGSGDSQLDQSVEAALKKVETKRNTNPEPMPPTSSSSQPPGGYASSSVTVAHRVALALVVAAIATGALGSVAHAQEPKGGVVIGRQRAEAHALSDRGPDEPGRRCRRLARDRHGRLVRPGRGRRVQSARPAGFLADLKAEGLGIDPKRWKDGGAYGVIKYRVTAGDVEFRLYEVSKNGTPSLTKTYPRRGDLRQIAHRWCNEVVKYYTGEPGFFGSKIAFAVKAKTGNGIYAMDFDGANAYSVSKNSSTNMFPSWSPTGRADRVHVLHAQQPGPLHRSGGRGAAQAGLEAPRHEHRRLLVAGRQQGRADALKGRQPGHLRHQHLRRCGDPAAHERQGDRYVAGVVAGWQPDRVRLGPQRRPQIFVVPAAGGAARQVSKIGSYNTTPTWSPRAGKQILAYTTRDGGTYDIAQRSTSCRVRWCGSRRTRAATRSPRSRRTAARSPSRAPVRVCSSRTRRDRQGREGLEWLGDRRRLGPGAQGLSHCGATPRRAWARARARARRRSRSLAPLVRPDRGTRAGART